MLLPYGTKDEQLIHVSEVESGSTDLICPYCKGNLIAKKGRVMVHHFAHQRQSCFSGDSDFFGLRKELKLQDSLLQFSRKMRNELSSKRKKLKGEHDRMQTKQQNAQRNIRKMFDSLKKIAPSTEAAKIAAQSVQTYLRNEFEPFPDLTKIRHADLYSYTNGSARKLTYKTIKEGAHTDYYPTYYHQPLLDLKAYHSVRHRLEELKEKLRLYEQDWEWFQKFRLYLLQIRVGEYAVFYKIGLTSRPLEKRVAEIKKNLAPSYPNAQIKVLYEIENHAYLEHFFKHKYRNHRHAFEQFTEYFKFEPYEIERICKQLDKLYT